MVSYGITYAVGLAAAGCAITSLLSWPFAIPFYILAAFCLNFFRDPERTVPEGPYAVSPADGKVMAVKQDDAGGHRISIFLNIFDVHVNRTPIGGKVTCVRTKKAGSWRPTRKMPVQPTNRTASRATAKSRGRRRAWSSSRSPGLSPAASYATC